MITIIMWLCVTFLIYHRKLDELFLAPFLMVSLIMAMLDIIIIAMLLEIEVPL